MVIPKMCESLSNILSNCIIMVIHRMSVVMFLMKSCDKQCEMFDVRILKFIITFDSWNRGQ